MSEWKSCDSACDPHARGARTEGAVHYTDCPVWGYLKVDPYVVWRESQNASFGPVRGDDR